MAPIFTALGVVFDLTKTLHQGDPRIIVKNKAARIDEICQDIDTYLDQDT